MTLTCPNCGSDQLRTRRAPYAKLFLGIFAPKNRVECRNCHEVFRPANRQGLRRAV